MPSTRRCGVDSALPKVSRPVLSSNTAMSVKVPPMSAASRRLAPLPAPNLRTAIVTNCHWISTASFTLLARWVSSARSRTAMNADELLRRQRLGIEGVLDEALLDLRRLQDADHLLVEALHDLLRQALRPGEREPGAGDEIVAQLLEGRHVRRLRPPRLGRHGERAERAALHLAQRRAPGERTHRHAAGDDVGEGRGVVGDVRQLEAVAPARHIRPPDGRACRRPDEA